MVGVVITQGLTGGRLSYEVEAWAGVDNMVSRATVVGAEVTHPGPLTGTFETIPCLSTALAVERAVELVSRDLTRAMGL